MDRLACVDLPALGLQLLQKRHPEWAAQPAAVVSRESPSGEVLSPCDRARSAGVLPGVTYAAALGLVPELRAGTMSKEELLAGKEQILALLGDFSPRVEPDKEEGSGSFWLDASGLGRLYPSPRVWAEALRGALLRDDFDGCVVVGFSRFGTYALARAGRGVFVLRSPEQERLLAGNVPLDRLDIRPVVRAELAKLGKTCVRQLAALPGEGLLERYGSDVHRLWALARGEVHRPLQPVAPAEPLCRELLLDDPELASTGLVFIVKSLLGGLLLAAAHGGQAVVALDIGLEQPGGAEKIERTIRPAEPTLDEGRLIDLVRLNLESLKPKRGVIAVNVHVRTAPATVEQLILFDGRSKRDLKEAEKALARVRAEFGDRAVVRVVSTDGHLPEARFRFEPAVDIRLPRPGAVERRCLVRRILSRPVPLGARPVCGPRGAHLAGFGQAPFIGSHGPYVVSGGWWQKEVHREYYFVWTESGRIAWVYYDTVRRSWFLHAEVE